MNSAILYGSNLPEQTNILMGMVESSGGTMTDFNIEISELSVENKLIYDNFINLTGIYSFVNLLNVPIYFDCTIVCPYVVNINVVDIDYNQLNEANKNIVESFLEFISI